MNRNMAFRMVRENDQVMTHVEWMTLHWMMPRAGTKPLFAIYESACVGGQVMPHAIRYAYYHHNQLEHFEGPPTDDLKRRVIFPRWEEAEALLQGEGGDICFDDVLGHVTN